MQLATLAQYKVASGFIQVNCKISANYYSVLFFCFLCINQLMYFLYELVNANKTKKDTIVVC